MMSGKLDRRITINQKTETQTSTGEAIETWAVFATVWAGKRDRSASEYFEADTDTAEIVTEFTIRKLDGIRNDMQIVLDGLTYDIEQILEIGRSRGHKVIARAVTP